MFRFSIVALLLIGHFISYAQTNGKLVQGEAIVSFSQIDLLGFGIPAENGIDLHKIWYETLGSDGQLDTASGLLILPQLTELPPPIISHHGTTSPRTAIPSNQQSHFGEIFYGAFGFPVVVADLLGMGESRGFHPYLHAATQASASIDLYRAASDYAADLSVELGDQVFVSGYSQGGHAAMSTLRALELDHADEFEVLAATPMSGPYNLSGTLRDEIAANEEYLFPAYLAYIAKGFQAAYGDIYEDVNELFKEPYASVVRPFDNQEDFTLGQLNDSLLILLNELEGASTPTALFQEEFLTAMVALDTTNRIVAAIVDNDVYDWVPQTPTRLYYCEADEQVPFENAVFTDSVMTANGAPDIEAMSQGAGLDHGGCAFVAFPVSADFFRSVLVASSTEKINENLDISFFPNPTQEHIQWQYEGRVLSITVFDVQGKRILQEVGDKYELDVTDLRSGVYFLQIQTTEGVSTQRFMKE
ncbi:MAG: T9SS type A sorting domain-containing protein [Bacteroidota bacterium]